MSWSWIELSLDVTQMYTDARAKERRERRAARASEGGRP